MKIILKLIFITVIFLDLKKTNIYFGLIPVVKKINYDYSSIDSIENFVLYYSTNCVNYKKPGSFNIIIKTLEDNSFAVNYPLIYNDLNIFDEFKYQKLHIYSIKKDRFFI